MIRTVEEIARIAGGMIREAQHGSAYGGRVAEKAPIDLVTEVDLAVEARIRAFFAERTPRIPVLGEEQGGARDLPTCWIVDPLDGTTNFVHGYPHFAVSIALREEGRIACGSVYDVLRDEMYSAVRGKGASRNGSPIHVSAAADIGVALLVTGFPPDRRTRAGHYLEFVRVLMERCHGIRRSGCASLDLARVACGGVEGMWEFGLNPWDVAAGSLLVEEAGGRVTGMAGEPLDLDGKRIVASNGHVHPQILDAIQGVMKANL